VACFVLTRPAYLYKLTGHSYGASRDIGSYSFVYKQDIPPGLAIHIFFKSTNQLQFQLASYFYTNIITTMINKKIETNMLHWDKFKKAFYNNPGGMTCL